MAVPAMADDKVETVTDGKLTVAKSPDLHHMNFIQSMKMATRHFAGFDMDLAKYIADKMGLELEVVPMDFDGVLSELSQKKKRRPWYGWSFTWPGSCRCNGILWIFITKADSHLYQ